MAHPEWTLRHVTFGRKLTNPSVHVRQRAEQALARFILRLGARSAEKDYLAHAPVVGDLVSAACSICADLYIAHYVAALPAAATAAEKHSARYAFDAEDFHLGDLPELPECAFEKALIRSIEGRLLPGAAYVTAASPLIAKAYAEYYGIMEPTVILNVFPRGNAPLAPTPHGTATPGPSLYWFSQTIGPGRGLEIALEALSLAKTKPHLHLRGTPAKGYSERLNAVAHKLGVADRIHYHKPVAPAELERSGTTFDLGYVGETVETKNRAIALTNKLFSSLTSGLPVIASSIPAHKELVRQLNGVMSLFDVGDARSLANLLDARLGDQDALTSLRAKAWALGQSTFCWEAEAPRLVECVLAALSVGSVSSIQ